jgi:hypothetical protein
VAKRLSEVFAARVAAAVDGLEILQAEKDQMEFEIVPAFQGQKFSFMVAISMPVGYGTDDYVMPMALCSEPHPRDDQLQMFVRKLADQALEWRDQQAATAKAALNGGTPPGRFPSPDRLAPEGV